VEADEIREMETTKTREADVRQTLKKTKNKGTRNG